MSNGNLEVILGGRYGNQLFMYFNARIFSEKNNLNLKTNPPEGPLNIKNNIIFGSEPKDLKNIIIDDNCYNSKDICYNYKGKGNYLFQGYFQKEEIIYENLNLIKSWINYDINKKDIAVIHVRLSDFYFRDSRHLILSQNYYIDTIKKYCENYKDIIIICDSLKEVWEDMYINNLKEKIKNLNKNPIYKNNSIKDDYQSIINSNLIITSNSTFCFWPMILSNADKIVSFPYFGYDINNNVACKWPGNHSIFKYNSNKNILNVIYDNNIIKYFENMKYYESYIIYYINLDKDKERNLFIKKEMDNKKLINERIQAVNGHEQKKVNYDNIMCSNVKFSQGQLGCYLSHIKCYEKFLKTKYNYLIILEDDIKLKNDFNEKISKLLIYLDKNNDIDFVYLSRSQEVIMKDSFTAKKSKYNNDFIFSPAVCGFGFHSYLLTKNGCSKFLKILKESEKQTFQKNKAIPLDCMDRWLILGNRMDINLNVYALYEEITKTRGLNSNTST